MPPNTSAISITGLASILGKDPEVDYESFETSFITGQSPKRATPAVDYTAEFKNELDTLGKSFNTSNYDFDLSKYSLPVKADDADDDAGPSSGPSGGSDKPERESWAPRDPHLSRITEEERRQSYVNKATADIYRSDDDADFINADDEEDELSKILEQIDQLYSILEIEGIPLGSIVKPGPHASKKEAKSVLKILQIKNDKLICCSLFEECVLAGAYALEDVFDGHREVFGRKYDLTGYSDMIKLKLRRMRYNTSTFVSGIMQAYNISPAWRILIELVPSLFLYSRDRKNKSTDTLVNNAEYNNARMDLFTRPPSQT
jgi:hypothetical protein